MLRTVEGEDIVVDVVVVVVPLRGWIVLSADNTLELLIRRVVVCGTRICRCFSAAVVARCEMILEARISG